jgi:hypothetical protein
MLVDCSLERVRGIEPPSSAWEAAALPLSYTREMARSAMERGWASTGDVGGNFPAYLGIYWENRGKRGLFGQNASKSRSNNRALRDNFPA